MDDPLQLEEQQNALKKRSKALTKSENRSPGKTILLISCRLNIYTNHFVSQIAKSLKFHECDLSSVDMCLTLSEKQEMYRECNIRKCEM